MFSWVTKRNLLSRRCSLKFSSSFFRLSRLFLSRRGRNWLSVSRRRFSWQRQIHLKHIQKKKKVTHTKKQSQWYAFCVARCACYQFVTLFRQECVSILQFPDNSTELCNFQLKSANVSFLLSLQTQHAHTHKHTPHTKVRPIVLEPDKLGEMFHCCGYRITTSQGQ